MEEGVPCRLFRVAARLLSDRVIWAQPRSCPVGWRTPAAVRVRGLRYGVVATPVNTGQDPTHIASLLNPHLPNPSLLAVTVFDGDSGRQSGHAKPAPTPKADLANTVRQAMPR